MAKGSADAPANGPCVRHEEGRDIAAGGEAYPEDIGILCRERNLIASIGSTPFFRQIRWPFASRTAPV